MIFMFGVGSVMVVNQLRRTDGVFISYGELIMAYPLFLGGLCAVFCSKFIGCEYSDGTIRNKIVVGSTRMSIYFANMITQFIALILFSLSYVFSVTLLGIPLLGLDSEFAYLDVLPLYIVAILFLMISFASIHTMFSMNISNKSTVAILSLLLFFALLISAFAIYSMLSAPEYYPGYVVTNYDTGEMQQEMIKNQNYVEGAKRTRYEFYFDFLPTGQAFQLAWLAAERLTHLPLYSIILTVVTTGIGWTIFRKKDLK